MYWEIGHYIRTEILEGERAEYGKGIVSTISTQLVQKYGQTFDIHSIRRMIRFAEKFDNLEIVTELVSQLNWTHLPPKADFEQKIKEILIETKERLEHRKSLPKSKMQKQLDYFYDPKDDETENL